jgi:hypothetical protein
VREGASRPARALHALLAGLPRQVKAQHPLTGVEEQFTLTRELVLDAVRGTLYAPALAAALPEAIDAASRGDYAGLVGLSATLGSGKAMRLATGMHLSVVCAEDLPRLGRDRRQAGRRLRQRVRRALREALLGVAARRGAAAFYSLPTSPSATLVLSGGIDPVTPPRHGERVAKALGPLARHVVVANAGHGVMAIGCMRDVIFRFVDAATDADALAVDAGCAAKVPRPPAVRVPALGPGQGVGAGPNDRGRASAAPGVRRRDAGQGLAGGAGLGGLLGLGRKRGAARVVHAVRDVSFHAPDGHITGLLGPNGAGKTTTLRMLAGLITPDAGSLAVDGIDVVAATARGAGADGRALGLARPLSAADRRARTSSTTARCRAWSATPPTRGRRTWRGCST